MSELSITSYEMNSNGGRRFNFLPGSKSFRAFVLSAFSVATIATVFPQTRTYPKEIRGYKVERVVVEIKRPEEIKKPKPKTENPASNQTQSSSENSANNTGQTNDPPASDSYADSD